MRASRIQSTNIKDYLIKKLSKKFNISQKEIEAVVDHQMQSINRAIQADNIFTVEMSGFGKWIFNHKKAQKQFEKNISKEKLFSSNLEKDNLTESQILSYTNKLNNTINWIKSIKPKIDKCPDLQNI